MRVLITGGAGFLGTLLARHLLAETHAVGGGPAVEVDELVLLDPAQPPPEVRGDPRVSLVTGGLDAVAAVGEVDVVLHLAGVVSGAAEADFDLGLRTNLDGTRAVLEWARAHPTPPILVFTSSLAVFGRDPAVAGPPNLVDDDTLPRPQSSYGFQKFIGEQLVADYTRRGYLRGRSVRLMTVAVRPGRPNAAASGFLSSLRPGAGARPPDDVPGPTGPTRRAVLTGPNHRRHPDRGRGVGRAVGEHRRDDPARTVHHPAGDGGGAGPGGRPGTSDLISWVEDPAVIAIVGSWPARFRTARAARLGLRANEDFDEVIREFLAADAASS